MEQTFEGNNWRQTGTCVDYLVCVRDLPTLEPSRWRAVAEQLRLLGISEESAFGVTTVRGAWGFFQIPAPGFPELKVTFFQAGEAAEKRSLLIAIANILEMER
jgi:hypothetical protein